MNVSTFVRICAKLVYIFQHGFTYNLELHLLADIDKHVGHYKLLLDSYWILHSFKSITIWKKSKAVFNFLLFWTPNKNLTCPQKWPTFNVMALEYNYIYIRSICNFILQYVWHNYDIYVYLFSQVNWIKFNFLMLHVEIFSF